MPYHCGGDFTDSNVPHDVSFTVYQWWFGITCFRIEPAPYAYEPIRRTSVWTLLKWLYFLVLNYLSLQRTERDIIFNLWQFERQRIALFFYPLRMGFLKRNGFIQYLKMLAINLKHKSLQSVIREPLTSQ